MTGRCPLSGLHAIINSHLAVGVPFPIDEAPTPAPSRNASPISIHGTDSAISLAGIVEGGYISGGTSPRDDVLTVRCGECQTVNQVPVNKDVYIVVFRGLSVGLFTDVVSPIFSHAILYFRCFLCRMMQRIRRMVYPVPTKGFMNLARQVFVHSKEHFGADMLSSYHVRE